MAFKSLLLHCMSLKVLPSFASVAMSGDPKNNSAPVSLLANLIEFTSDAVHVADEDGYLLHVNTRATRNLGYSREEMLRMNVRDFESIFADDDAWRGHIRELEESPDGILIQGQNQRKDGSTFPVEVNVRLVAVEGKRFVVAVLRDISEREENRAITLKYQEDLDEAQLLAQMGSFEFDPKTEQIQWSNNAPAVFGLPVDTDLATYDIPQLIHPQDRESALSLWAKAVDDSTTFSADYRILTPKGETRFIQGRGKPVFAADGSLKAIRGTVQDITETWKAQEELKVSEKKYRNLLENLNLGLMEVDTEGKVVEVSESFCKNVGYSREELIDSYPHHFLIEEDQMPILMEQRESREQGNSNVYELRIMRKEGQVMWFLISAAPVYDVSGRIVGSMGVHMNITARKRNEQKLKHYARDLEAINRELDQFAYIVSHDLKAPLRAINNLSQWIEEDLGTHLSGETKTHFDLLRGRVQRMENLINGILQYSRVSRTNRKLELVSLNKILREVMDSIRLLDDKASLTWDEELPQLMAERIALQQVFTNLIHNAVKYNDKGRPEVHVSCKRKGRLWEFCVTDNGPGIDPKFHHKIFQIFQTLQARDQVESTGVGLAIVKKILEEHGQTIRVHSEPDAGASFCFTWPVHHPKPSKEEV
ncbi:MAG: PAS domain S-box protein [Leptolyngbya sp. SIO3F4]|nr:PAS domain S-box protein [Leptolyngbya sp. SIO3F4]